VARTTRIGTYFISLISNSSKDKDSTCPFQEQSETSLTIWHCRRRRALYGYRNAFQWLPRGISYPPGNLTLLYDDFLTSSFGRNSTFGYNNILLFNHIG